MKVKVINKYRDKETMQIVPAGTIIPDMRKERFDEIQSAGNFLEELPEPTIERVTGAGKRAWDSRLQQNEKGRTVRGLRGEVI